MIPTPLAHCPSCQSSELIITQQTCLNCGVVVSGQFKPNIFSQLSSENLAFVEVFVKNRGNVKEMERELGVSYWAIRNQLNEVIKALGFEDLAPDTDEFEKKSLRREVLAQLERNEISVEAAAKAIKQIQQRH